VITYGGRELSGLGEITAADLTEMGNKGIAKKSAMFDAFLTNASLYKILQPELDYAQNLLDAATTASDRWFNQITGMAPDVISLGMYVSTLRTLRNQAKVAYANNPNDASPIVEPSRQAVLNIYRWGLGFTTSALNTSNKNAQWFIDAPVNLVKYVVKGAGEVVAEAAQSLGLPKWAIPVALGTLGVVAIGQLTGGIGSLSSVVKGLKKQVVGNPPRRKKGRARPKKRRPAKRRKRLPVLDLRGSIDTAWSRAIDDWDRRRALDPHAQLRLARNPGVSR